MVNVYIDDSGTALSQRIAVASALIIPAIRIGRLEVEWANFCEKYEITAKGFHSSECVARNPKSEYANWDDTKVQKALNRVGQITKKYGVRALSFAVKKTDYDDLMPRKWKNFAGRHHYTWAIKHVFSLLRGWRDATNPDNPVEYFFDWQEGEPKKEIETMMSQEEVVRPGQYEDHYSFRKRQDIPALQCTDLLAWSSLAVARQYFEGTPISEHAKRVYKDFRTHRNETWMIGRTIGRQNLADTIRRRLVDNLEEKEKKEWYAHHAKECSRVS
jgi:hypothetical protein